MYHIFTRIPITEEILHFETLCTIIVKAERKEWVEIFSGNISIDTRYKNMKTPIFEKRWLKFLGDHWKFQFLDLDPFFQKIIQIVNSRDIYIISILTNNGKLFDLVWKHEKNLFPYVSIQEILEKTHPKKQFQIKKYISKFVRDKQYDLILLNPFSALEALGYKSTIGAESFQSAINSWNQNYYGNFFEQRNLFIFLKRDEKKGYVSSFGFFDNETHLGGSFSYRGDMSLLEKMSDRYQTFKDSNDFF